jgi:hypothetical protein
MGTLRVYVGGWGPFFVHHLILSIMEVNVSGKMRAQAKRARRRKPVSEICFVIALFISVWAQAQDGDAGINQANTMIRDYFNTGVNLLYACGGILGLIGAVKVYQKWSHGDRDTSAVAASWFGSCIFLVVVATLLRSFFGL